MYNLKLKTTILFHHNILQILIINSNINYLIIYIRHIHGHFIKLIFKTELFGINYNIPICNYDYFIIVLKI